MIMWNLAKIMDVGEDDWIVRVIKREWLSLWRLGIRLMWWGVLWCAKRIVWGGLGDGLGMYGGVDGM